MCLRVALSLALAAFLTASTHDAASASATLDPTLLEHLAAGPDRFFVVLRVQADVSTPASIPSRSARTRAVVERLKDAASSQDLLARQLEARGVLRHRFWIANALVVEGDAHLALELASRAEVLRVEPDPRLAIPQTTAEPPRPSAGVEWNVARIRAPEVWAAGVRGAGAVVGGIDTGCDWTHPALLAQYRGWDGSVATHDHNWHDAVHTGGDACGPDVMEPCDANGHGTYTMGTMVGDDGGANRIGVAPEARWIGCRCWESAGGTRLSYVTECFEWMVAPTSLDGTDPDPSLAPDAVTNSWICEPSEGCSDPLVLRLVVENVRAAGIFVEAGAGNDGPACATIVYPPAIYEAAFSVGATTSTDAIASFSSRGPVTVDGSDRTKPDACAPGASIRSSVPGGGYVVQSGTSAAGPHVTGLVALLVSADPSLAGRVDELDQIVRTTCVPLSPTGGCGLAGEVPNNVYGYGRIDAFAAYQAAVTVDVPDPTALSAEKALLRVAPNPFRAGVEIRVVRGGTGPTRVTIHDAAGRLVRILAADPAASGGDRVVTWHGDDVHGEPLPAGTYFIRLPGPTGSHARRVTLVR